MRCNAFWLGAKRAGAFGMNLECGNAVVSNCIGESICICSKGLRKVWHLRNVSGSEGHIVGVFFTLGINCG
jgi:hypothetical protein